MHKRRKRKILDNEFTEPLQECIKRFAAFIEEHKAYFDYVNKCYNNKRWNVEAFEPENHEQVMEVIKLFETYERYEQANNVNCPSEALLISPLMISMHVEVRQLYLSHLLVQGRLYKRFLKQLAKDAIRLRKDYETLKSNSKFQELYRYTLDLIVSLKKRQRVNQLRIAMFQPFPSKNHPLSNI